MNKVEKAEMAQNSTIAFEEKAIEAEQTALENIRDVLQQEFIALARERNDAQGIINRANQDIDCLNELFDQKIRLEDILRGSSATAMVAAVPGLIELERAEYRIARRIEQAIHDREANLTNVGGDNLKDIEANFSGNVRWYRGQFQRALEEVEVTERLAAQALKRNAIHMECDITGDADQAIERLQRIKDDLVAQDDEGLKNRSKGHLFIDPKVGKFTIGDAAIWMSVREINDWGPADSATIHPDETHVTYRPDIVKIETNIVTREAKALVVEPIYTKRLSERFFTSDGLEYRLVVDGRTFASGGRRRGVLTIVDRKKIGTAKQDGTLWTEEECTRRRIFDMEGTGTIKIVENHNNQAHPETVSFSANIETMPNPVINHQEALDRRQGEGWTDEQKRRMCKLDLDRRVLILPNGQEYPIDEFDWTETRWDEENGLTLQYKGPRELSQVNLLAAGSSDIFNEKLSDATTALKKKKRKHLEDGIEWLKQSIKSYDEDKINTALVSIQSYEGIESYQSSITKNELERPPKNRHHLKDLREKKKLQRNALTPKSVAAEMLTARQGYEKKVKERIQAIHKKSPLSAEYVWKTRAKPETYSLQKHTSSKMKQDLRDEIRAANHLDKTVHFQLLEDPKQGPASATSPVKNVAPNGLELLQEYNRYANQPDIGNQIERQNVAQYVANIATEFQTNQNVHPYYANQWKFERAIEAVTRGEILSKVVNRRNIIGASEYIKNLKQVDCPPDSDDSLAGLRQADEYHWVTCLRNRLDGLSSEGIEEVINEALSVAQWMQASRYGNLKRAEMSLNLETTSEEAKKILDNMEIVATPLPWFPDPEQEKAKADTTKDKNKFDPEVIKNKTDAQLAEEAAAIAEKVYKNAIDAIDRLIASTDDPALQKKYREAAANWVIDLAKQTFEINKQDKSIQNQWQKLEVLIKETDKQRWKDLWKELMLIWLKTSVESGGKGVQKFMSEFEKIVAKSLL